MQAWIGDKGTTGTAGIMWSWSKERFYRHRYTSRERKAGNRRRRTRSTETSWLFSSMRIEEVLQETRVALLNGKYRLFFWSSSVTGSEDHQTHSWGVLPFYLRLQKEEDFPQSIWRDLQWIYVKDRQYKLSWIFQLANLITTQWWGWLIKWNCEAIPHIFIYCIRREGEK